MSPSSDPLSVAATSNPPNRVGTSPNVTGSLLTASNPRAPASSRGVVIAALGATVVGGALALAGFAIMRGKTHAGGASSGLSASVVDVPHATASAPIAAIDPVATADAGALDVVEPPHEQKAGSHHHGGGRPGVRSLRAGPGRRRRCLRQGGAVITTTPSEPVAVPTPAPTAAPPAIVAPKPAPTAAPKPASTAIDPGY